MSPRARRTLSLILVVLGGLATAAGVAAVYAHHVLVDRDGFADHVVQAVREPAVSRELSTQLANELVRAVPDLVAAERPLEDATASVLETGAFEPVVRRAALVLHDEAFGEGGSALRLDLTDGLQILGSVVALRDPALRKRIESATSADVVTLDRSGVTKAVTDAGRVISWLAVALPLMALALFVAAVLVAQARGRALGWVGVAIAAAGAVLFAAEIVTRTVASRQSYAAPAAVEQAVGAFVGDVTGVALVLGVAGAAIAAAGWGRLSAGANERAAGRAWAFLRGSSDRGRVRALRAALLIVLGVLLLAEPLATVQILAIGVGFFALVEGLTEVVAVLGGPQPADVERRPHAHRGAFASGVALALGVAAIAAIAVVALTRIPESEASLSDACNGSTELCDRPLDRVVLATSHNAMSSAQDGFIDPNNQRSIVEQLDGGVRGLLIDSLTARPTSRASTALTVLDGEVLASARRDLGAGGLAALEDFLARRIAKPTGGPEPYFCHIVCELGAITMHDTLSKIDAWLEQNPREVVVIVIQDLVSPQITQTMFQRSGLYDRAYTWNRGEPAPTLRRMIEEDRRLLVMAEVDGYPNGWYQPGYDRLLKETPYDSPTLAALRSRTSCRPNRGKEANPLFLLNHWVAVYPPRLSNAQKVNRRAFLLGRARRCQAIRGALPNLVAVDFAGSGDLIEVVAELNGLRAR